MTEAEFQKKVIEIAKRYGWIVYHVPDSRRVTAKGCPDLIMIHERQTRLVFAELKADRGKVSPEQALWLRVLAACGVETALWRPADLTVIPAFLRSRHGALQDPK